MVVIQVSIVEAKAKLSEYLDRAASGERILICRHNTPVAELRAVEQMRTEPRPIGPLPGEPRFDIAESFFDPMSDGELALWEGGSANDPSTTSWRVAETRTPYAASPRKSPSTRKRR